MAEENGVWRTVRGRRVFIRDGEDLESAMKRSGKFERKQKIQNDETEDIKQLNDLSKSGKINQEQYNNARKETVDFYKKRLKGKDSITDIPEAYRQYEQDYENELMSREYYGGYSSAKMPEEKDYLPGGKKWNNEWESSREYKTSKDNLDNLKSQGREARAREIDKINSDENKEMYNSKEYAKWLSKSYNADSEYEYEDKITPKYVQDIDAGRYGNMSDEEAIKNWIDGGADIIYIDDAEKQLKAWGIPVRNDDAYGTYKSELAKQLAPIYRSDKQNASLSKMSITDLREMANDYGLDAKGKSKKQLLGALISMFNK